MKISKELLSEVFNINVHHIHTDTKDDVVGFRLDTTYGITDRYINIHELQHRCKEWAFDNMYMVRTNYENTIDGKLCRVSISKNCEFNEHGSWFYSTCSNTEPDVVFKAIQYILDNKDSK